jgi:hypothetical protein
MIAFFRSLRDGIALERRRAQWRLLILFTAVKLTIFAVVCMIAWLLLSHAAPGFSGGQTRTTTAFLASGVFQVFFELQLADFFAGWYSVGPPAGTKAAASFACAVMGAVEAREMRLAHAVIVIPGGANGADVAPSDRATVETLAPLGRPMRALALHDGVYLLGALGGVAAIGLGLGLAVVTLNSQSLRANPGQTAVWLAGFALPLTLTLVGIAVSLWTLTARRFARLERQPFTAAVDGEGVTFRQANASQRERRLRWSDARGFARILFTDEMGRVHEVFVLSAVDEYFLWEALYAVPSATVAEIQREEAWRVAAHRLVEVVERRTGLPLLDPTETLFAALTTTAGASVGNAWNVFDRAMFVARADGDTRLASEIAKRLYPGTLAAWSPLMWFGARMRNLRRLTATQRAEALRVARTLLPYYPTPAQLIPNARRRLLIRGYLGSEIALQLLLIALAFANFILSLSLAS